MAESKTIKRYILFAIAIFLWGLFYIIGHSSFVSDYLKQITINAAQNYVHQKATVQNIYLNIFPLNLEITKLSLEDDKGEKWLTAERIKIYPSLLDLLKKKIKIKRLFFSGGYVHLTDANLGMVSALTARRQEQKDQTKGVKVELKVLDVRRTRIIFDSSDVHAEGKNVRLSAVIGDKPMVSFEVPELALRKDAVAIENLSVHGRLSLRGPAVFLQTLKASTKYSTLSFKGKYVTDTGESDGDIDLSLDVEEVSRLLHLGVIKEGKLSASGKLSYSSQGIGAEINTSGDLYLESLMSALRLSAPFKGFTRFSGRISLQGRELLASGKAELIKAQIYGIDIDRGNVNVGYEGGELKFTEGKASVYGGTAEVNVALSMPEVERFTVNVEVQKVSARDLARLIQLPFPVPEGVVTGSLKSEGEHFDPAGNFVAQFKPIPGNVFQKIEKVRGSFRSAGPSIELQGLEIHTALSKGSVDGELNTADKSISLTGTIETSNIMDLASPFLTDVAGSGSGSFAVSGSLDNPEAKGTVRLAGVGYRTYSMDRLDLVFDYRDGMLNIPKMVLFSEDEKQEISGSVNFKNEDHSFNFSDPLFNITLKLNKLKIGHLLRLWGGTLPVDGLVSSDISVRGRLKKLSARGDVKISPVSVYGVPLDYIRSDVYFENNAFTFSEITAAKNDSLLSVRLSVDLEGKYEITTHKITIRPDVFPQKIGLEKGEIDIVLEGKGSLKHPNLVSRLRMKGFLVDGLPVGDGDVLAVLRDNNITFSGKLFDGKAALEGSVALYGNVDWNISLNFERGSYDFIPVYVLKEVPEDLMLNLEGKLRLRGNRNEWEGSLTLNNVNLSMYGYNFSNASEIKVAVKNGEIIFENLHLRSGSASFSVGGSLVPRKRFDVQIYGDSSLSPMRRFFKSIEAIKGNGSFVFLITGDWNNPVINGGSTIADGTLGIKEFPHRIYDLKSYIFVDNNTVVVESLSGKMGGGNIHMKGYGLIKNFSLQSFSLDAQLTDVTLKITRGFMVNFNGNLIYRGEKGKNSMVGQVEIIQARYSQRIDWKTQLLKPKLAEKPRGTLNPFLETELNIKVDGTNEIIVDNNIAKTSLNVDLLLRGTIANPLLFGRIETNKGKVYFRNNEFDIIHASADFVDPEKLNPYFDVTATTSVKGYNIRITIEGQIQHFDLSLLSDPRLDETDILSLLAVGELGGKTKGMEGGMGTAEATSFLTGEYQDVIEERLTSITGFDRFQVEPYVSEKKGTVGPRVTVSKRLIGDKLYLSYSSAFEATQADIIKLEYQIDKHVSLVGFRDQLGSIGSDVRFRFEFK